MVLQVYWRLCKCWTWQSVQTALIFTLNRISLVRFSKRSITEKTKKTQKPSRLSRKEENEENFNQKRTIIRNRNSWV